MTPDDRLARCGCVVYALIEPRIYALKRPVGVEGFPQLCAICREFYSRYPDVGAIDMAE